MTTLYLDLDGTLIDVRRRHHAVYTDALDVLGAESMGEEQYWTMRRRGASSTALARGANGAAVPGFSEAWHQRIERPSYLRLDTLVTGAMEAIAQLSASYELVLVTLRREEGALRQQLDDLGLAGAFRDVYSRSSAPKAAGKAALMRALRLTEAEDVVVGDSEADIEAAQAFGMDLVCVCNGVRCRRFLHRAGAERIVSSIALASEALRASARHAPASV